MDKPSSVPGDPRVEARLLTLLATIERGLAYPANGALHCRGCSAGSHNRWAHDAYCPIRDQELAVDAARKASQELAEALAAERPARAQEPPEWQPIETAPQDGAWLWARFGEKNPRVTTLRWDAEMGMWMSGTGFWHDHGPFTHWAPLNAVSPDAALAASERPAQEGT